MSLRQPMSPVDFHVLLVLSQGALYGYAIMKAVEEESGGAVAPEIGSLYRVLGRLVSHGVVDQLDGGDGEGVVHPGRQRKYYALTPKGERTLRAEAARLGGVLEIARRRRLLPEGGGR